MAGDLGNLCATVDQVPLSFLLQAEMHSNIQPIVDKLWNCCKGRQNHGSLYCL